LCAGSEEANKDACDEDSGGPLLYIDGNRHVLIGLVSWGDGCGIANMPGVYARVSKGMYWIKKVVCECWNVEGASFCGDEVSTAAEEEWTFECPIQVDPNCQDTPGYVDYAGDVCAWYEYNKNPGCVDYGDSKGGPGFEDTNALGECCWCGGGSIVKPSSPVKFERDPECQDVEGWTDQHGDDCQWYEANTEEGTCSGWGDVPGNKGFRKVLADIACCHCGGGSYPTPAPSPMPSISPTRRDSPTPQAPQTPDGGPTSTGNKPNKAPPKPSVAPQVPTSGPTTTTDDNNNNSQPSSPPEDFVVGQWPKQWAQKSVNCRSHRILCPEDRG